MSVSSAEAKAEALATLREGGYDARSGAVRLAYPFAIMVPDVDEADAAAVTGLVSRVDPGAGTIVGAPAPV